MAPFFAEMPQLSLVLESPVVPIFFLGGRQSQQHIHSVWLLQIGGNFPHMTLPHSRSQT